MPFVTYRFGPFLLDPEDGRLWYGGAPVHLPYKAFQLLVILVSAEGHLVEKKDIISSLWPDAHVEEANLPQAVFVVRKALGVAPGGYLYVETVPKMGYRMATKVIRIEPPSATVSTASPINLKLVLLAAAALAATVLMLLLWR